MPRINTFKEMNFTNSIGQVIEPGDEILAITKGGYSKKIKAYKAIYNGVFLDKKGNIVSVSVFGSTKTCYKNTGQKRKYTATVYKNGIRELVEKEYPVYEPYKRVVSVALPRKNIFKIATS